MLHIWPETCCLKTIFSDKIFYSYGDNEFFLRDCFLLGRLVCIIVVIIPMRRWNLNPLFFTCYYQTGTCFVKILVAGQRTGIKDVTSSTNQKKMNWNWQFISVIYDFSPDLMAVYHVINQFRLNFLYEWKLGDTFKWHRFFSRLDILFITKLVLSKHTSN